MYEDKKEREFQSKTCEEIKRPLSHYYTSKI